MHITRLRLLGFKSFAEQTELHIEPGLTGVVGPNGCGKSNLLEALRWVMGEISYKNMRGAAMDDVIFSGTHIRTARNHAEVSLLFDNSDHTASHDFKDEERIEVTRRIERDGGSAYKMNGRDVRARDVQLLFADAATGARSPSLVQQGRIGEIVNAKPQARRQVLEEAAGITGLHSRRHEAELRLRATETNLERLTDIMGQIGSQLSSLKRQARQARRYKETSANIEQAEAMQFHLRWQETGQLVSSEEAALERAMRTVETETRRESEALQRQTERAEALIPLREEQASRATALHRLQVEKESIDEEEKRIEERFRELKTRLEQLEHDLLRERALIIEANEILRRLDEEKKILSSANMNGKEMAAAARISLEEAAAKLSETEICLSTVTTQNADHKACRHQFEQTLKECDQQLEGVNKQVYETDRQIENFSQNQTETSEISTLIQKIEGQESRLIDIEQKMVAAEDALKETHRDEEEKSEAAQQAKLKAHQLETERDTLRKLLKPSKMSEWPPLADQLTVTPGYESALGAILGDDMDAPIDQASPVYWRTLLGEVGSEPLPYGVSSMSDFVAAPQELKRLLAHIGLVDQPQGNRLQADLKPGQCLVSIDGDVWRWDGYVAAANAPTAAAMRLTEQNRLTQLEQQEGEVFQARESREEALILSRQQREMREQQERQFRQEWRSLQNDLADTRSGLARAERKAQEDHEKRARLKEAKAHLSQSHQEIMARKAQAEEGLSELEPAEIIGAQFSRYLALVEEHRSHFTDARAAVANLERDQHLKKARKNTLDEEERRWQSHSESAEAQIADLQERIEKTISDLQSLQTMPAKLKERRAHLRDQTETSEAQSRKAGEALGEAEVRLRDVENILGDARENLSSAREERARIEARLEAARARRGDEARRIREGLGCPPEDCLKRAGLEEGEETPKLQDIEIRLQKLKTDRERLGEINLRAEDESTELIEKIDSMELEQQDLEKAIASLRQAISNLNRESRKRLLEAFDTVNAHFQRLFQVLFGGGEAELQLTEADDPLEAGLEIIAMPPGKKRQTLTLLSGGEKALTALSLIFAVFLTNPSPICVLDEVDAPLDDSNVDRFCRMMDEMASSTKTRFLVITHHPITMSRMDRLFGVTMAERGISQLVSVDLATAERFREAS